MVVFETHEDKKSRVGCGVAPQTPTPLHTMGQKRCVWVLRMGVFETHHAKKIYGVGSGLVPQTRIPLRTVGQKRCFWIPKMVVFETHHDKKICCGFRGGAPNTHTTAQHKPEQVFLDPWDACL